MLICVILAQAGIQDSSYKLLATNLKLNVSRPRILLRLRPGLASPLNQLPACFLL